MNIWNNVYQYFTTLTLTSWLHVLAFILLAAILSGTVYVSRPLLKRCESKYGVEYKKLAISLLTLLSASVTALGNYLASHPERMHGFLANTAALSFATVLFYHFGGKSTFDWIAKALQDLSDYLSTGKLPS